MSKHNENTELFHVLAKKISKLCTPIEVLDFLFDKKSQIPVKTLLVEICATELICLFDAVCWQIRELHHHNQTFKDPAIYYEIERLITFLRNNLFQAFQHNYPIQIPTDVKRFGEKIFSSSSRYSMRRYILTPGAEVPNQCSVDIKITSTEISPIILACALHLKHLYKESFDKKQKSIKNTQYLFEAIAIIGFIITMILAFNQMQYPINLDTYKLLELSLSDCQDMFDINIRASKFNGKKTNAKIIATNNKKALRN